MTMKNVYVIADCYTIYNETLGLMSFLLTNAECNANSDVNFIINPSGRSNIILQKMTDIADGLSMCLLLFDRMLGTSQFLSGVSLPDC